MSMDALPKADTRLTHQSKVLLMLDAAGPAGVTSEDLLKVTHRFSARVWDLKQRGWDIETVEREGVDMVRYVLHTEVKTMAQPDMLQQPPPAQPTAPMLVGICKCTHLKAHHAFGTKACRDCLCGRFTQPDLDPEPSLF